MERRGAGGLFQVVRWVLLYKTCGEWRDTNTTFPAGERAMRRLSRQATFPVLRECQVDAISRIAFFLVTLLPLVPSLMASIMNCAL